MGAGQGHAGQRHFRGPVADYVGPVVGIPAIPLERDTEEVLPVQPVTQPIQGDTSWYPTGSVNILPRPERYLMPSSRDTPVCAPAAITASRSTLVNAIFCLILLVWIIMIRISAALARRDGGTRHGERWDRPSVSLKLLDTETITSGPMEGPPRRTETFHPPFLNLFCINHFAGPRWKVPCPAPCGTRCPMPGAPLLMDRAGPPGRPSTNPALS